MTDIELLIEEYGSAVDPIELEGAVHEVAAAIAAKERLQAVSADKQGPAGQIAYLVEKRGVEYARSVLRNLAELAKERGK